MEGFYRGWLRWLAAHPGAKRALGAFSKGTVALVYGVYLGMLAALALWRDARLLRVVLVPAFAFCAGTLLRAVIDRPRPYETLGFTPAFPKKTRGQSMPSRHCFCAAAIAVAAWYLSPPLGAFAAALAAAVGVCRVVCGVHWPGDVLAGWAFGAAVAAVGFYLI